MMTTDPDTTSAVLSGEILSQSSGSFSVSSVSGNAVYYEEGQRQSPSDSVATLGLVSFDGKGGGTVVSQDKNESGVHTNKGNQPVTYSVQSNGRGVVTGPNNPSIFYLITASPDASAFILETNGSAGTGFVQQQAAGPFSASGNYIFGVAAPAVPVSVLTSGIATSTGNGTLNITADLSGPLGLASGQTTSATGLNISSTGVGTDGQGDVIYIISATQAVLINTSGTAPEVVVIQQ